MHISILGRQPELAIAELERLYGTVHWLSTEAARIDAPSVDLMRLGGSQKIGRVVSELARGDWFQVSRALVRAYEQAWRTHEGKLTLGISAYGFDRLSPREVQKTGIILKKKLKESGVSLRLVPNETVALSSATSHHNKLGLSDNKVELLIIRSSSGQIVIAESTGSQNITAYAKRDRGRPKRDAFVGMLPPKLAQMMINLALPDASTSQAPKSDKTPTLLDPFCGTGVILQEAALMGYSVYGTDLSSKMIDFSDQNLEWLSKTHQINFDSRIEQGDAMDHIWRQPINAIACEAYLGQPFSAPPSPAKLHEVRSNCNHIISQFLKNIGSQIDAGMSLCIAVPAWRDSTGRFTHLPLTNSLEGLGYQRIKLDNVTADQLIYYRDDQVVARELLLITKS